MGEKVTFNGVVKPADSLNFTNDPCLKNVDFYQWSEQMFLWLTSPAPNKLDGNKGIILNSSAFFRVSPLDSSNQRHLIPNGDRQSRLLALRAAKPGPNGLPVILDKAGKLWEVKLPELSRNKNPLVLSAAGPVEVQKIRFVPKDKLPFEFLGSKDARIRNPKPILPPALRGQSIVQPFTLPVAQRFATGYVTVFLNSSGEAVDVGEGQGTSNAVLLTQRRALVHYMTSVNDCYAHFLRGTKSGGICPTPKHFPTTQAQLDKITAFAKATGYTVRNPRTLCMQIKTSWIEVDTLPKGDRDSYIQMEATIPTYDTTNDQLWRPKDRKRTKLALVGMHISGSVKGHPEMIWATFEHFGNSPNATYRYISNDGSTKTVWQNTTGTWLLCRTGATSPFNHSIQEAHRVGDKIVIRAFEGKAIGPTNTLRCSPFGAPYAQRPNPNVLDAPASNTQIISMNNSVRAQLPTCDIRANYFMLGATWTDGNAPDNSPLRRNIMGTSRLANSTMETFAQRSNCFSCHNDRCPDRPRRMSPANYPTAVTTDVSHIFCTLQWPRSR